MASQPPPAYETAAQGRSAACGAMANSLEVRRPRQYNRRDRPACGPPARRFHSSPAWRMHDTGGCNTDSSFSDGRSRRCGTRRFHGDRSPFQGQRMFPITGGTQAGHGCPISEPSRSRAGAEAGRIGCENEPMLRYLQPRGFVVNPTDPGAPIPGDASRAPAQAAVLARPTEVGTDIARIATKQPCGRPTMLESAIIDGGPKAAERPCPAISIADAHAGNAPEQMPCGS
jgi:hypothetical protein